MKKLLFFSAVLCTSSVALAQDSEIEFQKNKVLQEELKAIESRFGVPKNYQDSIILAKELIDKLPKENLLLFKDSFNSANATSSEKFNQEINLYIDEKLTLKK